MSFIRKISPSQQHFSQNNNLHHNVLRKLSSDKKESKQARQRASDDRVARSIFGDVPLTDTERRFLAAASCGYLYEVQLCIQENVNLNLNCRDYLGRSALQLAVQGEHYDTVIYLLDRCGLDVIEEALLYAIKTESVKICDIFLNHPIYSDRRARIQLEFQHGFYDQEESSSTFAPDITPIVLAAQCNNFDIVHMLLQKGFSIQRPHNYFCYCTECSNHKTFDRFVHSRSRLNAYRGLASTAYISLSSDDPIVTAFELSRQLHNLAEREKEYKSEYKSLCELCKNYAVELLELCRSNEEVLAALHGGANTRDLSRIKLAIRYEQKKFVAHASCQEHLMSIWYAGVPWFQHQNFLLKFLLLPLGILLIPLTAIVYVFLPYSKVGEVLRSPFMKFMNYVCSYTAFLVLLFVETAQTTATRVSGSNETAHVQTTSETPPTKSKSLDLLHGTEGVVNTLIMLYIVGMFWAECKQLLIEGVRDYFSQIWNFMDIAMLALYTASFSVQAVVHSKAMQLGDFEKDHYVTMSPDGVFNPQVLGKVLFSVANVLSFARIAYILPASEMFGQLQISYGRMLQDVGKFIFIYSTVLVAFVCGLSSLYSLNNSQHFNSLLATTGTLFWATFGMGNSRAPIIEDEKEDKASEDDFKVVEATGYLLYGAYILGAVVVLINMLIAMMSNTFQEIQDDEDVEWKFARAKLWISFVEEGSTLPIPFNIIPTPKSLARLAVEIKQCCFRRLSIGDTEPQPAAPDSSIDYKAIMHKVVLRYIHKMKFDKKGDPAKDELSEARDEILAQLTNVHTKLSDRLGRIERDIRYLETAVTGDKVQSAPRRTPSCTPLLHPMGKDALPRVPPIPRNSPSPRPGQGPRAPRYDLPRSRWSQDRESHQRHASERAPKSAVSWSSPHRASYTAGGRRRLVNSIYLRDFRRPQRLSESESPSEAASNDTTPRTEPLQRKTFSSSEV